MKYYRTTSRGLYVYLIKKGFTDVIYATRDGRYMWTWVETDELNEAIKEFYDRPPADFMRRKNAQLITSVWLKDKLISLGYRPFDEEPDKYDWRKTIWLFDKSPELEMDLDYIFRKDNTASNIPKHNKNRCWDDKF